jgi:glutamyl-tRNA synthetase
MPDHDWTWTDLVRGEVSVAAAHLPDFVITRSNGDPLYTLVNPLDDALMRITHVLRGEDLLSSTPRQVVLYRALIELGIATAEPVYGHLPYVMGEGNKKLSKRDPESNLFLLRDRGFIPEGLLNYLALLGWGIAPDNDVFTVDELIAAFDVADVNPNPSRFDIKKAESINGAHVRMLAPEDFRARVVSYLHAAGLVSAEEYAGLTDAERTVLDAAAPLVQERITLLAEAVGMLGFLFTADVEVADDARAALAADAPQVLDAASAALEGRDVFDAATIHAALDAALIVGLGLKPRVAFTPLRVAVTGRRVSPPLFESMELLGRDVVLTRLSALRATL